MPQAVCVGSNEKVKKTSNRNPAAFNLHRQSDSSRSNATISTGRTAKQVLRVSPRLSASVDTRYAGVSDAELSQSKIGEKTRQTVNNRLIQ